MTRATRSGAIRGMTGWLAAAKLHAHLGQLRRERGRVRPLPFALYRFIRYEPCVSPVAPVLFSRLPPADVCLVLIGNADCELVQFHIAGFCKVENVFVAVIEEPLTHYRLEVPNCYVAGNVWVAADVCLAYCYRLDPVDYVLQDKVLSQRRSDVPRYPLVLWLVADIEKERAVVCQSAPNGNAHLFHPRQVLFARQRVVVQTIIDANVVRRRRDYNID